MKWIDVCKRDTCAASNGVADNTQPIQSSAKKCLILDVKNSRSSAFAPPPATRSQNHRETAFASRLTKMSPDGIDDLQPPITQTIDLEATVLRRKVQVRLARHDEHLRSDILQAERELAAVPHARDVAGLPGPEQGEHVVGVPILDEGLFPFFANEGVQVGVFAIVEVHVLAVPLQYVSFSTQIG